MTDYTPRHKIDVTNAASIAELVKKAVLEESGDDILYIKYFAKTPILSADVTIDLWEYGGTKNKLLEGRSHTVVSSSEDDNSTGAGARYVYFMGVNEYNDIVNEVVTLNGTTPVNLTNKYLCIYRCIVLAAGTSCTNIGDITVTETEEDSVQAYILAEKGISHSCHFICPNNYTALLCDLSMSIYRTSGSGVKRGETELNIISRTGVCFGAFTFSTTNDGGITKAGAVVPLVLRPNSQLNFTAVSESDAARISLAYDLILIKGNYADNHSIFY